MPTCTASPGWTTLDNTWEGVSFKTLLDRAKPTDEAKWVIAHCAHGYTSNLSLQSMADDDVLVAWRNHGEDLTPEHGWPLRLVVPKRYAWKSAKWLTGLEFSAKNKRGLLGGPGLPHPRGAVRRGALQLPGGSARRARAVTEGLDLEAYLQRIGYSGGLDPTIETLTALHRAHALSIPFENLDILLGRPIRLDLASLQAKLVHDRRGGYCFEQNALFAAVLEHLGFAVTGLAARVSMGEERTTPRTHMVLAVDIGETRWLADVGFGGDTLLDPISFDDDAPVQQGAWAFRLADDGDLRILWGLRADGWLDLYSFTLEPQLPVDYEVANHYTSTWPRSPFVTKIIAQRSGLDERWMLIEDELRVERPNGTERWTVVSHAERLSILADRFELIFPPGTHFGRD